MAPNQINISVKEHPIKSKSNHIAHHKVVKSNTLMRKAVNKPMHSLRRTLRVVPAIDSDFKTVLVSGEKLSSNANKIRVKIKKSSKIKHFANLNDIRFSNPLFDKTFVSPISISPKIQKTSQRSSPESKSHLDILLENGLKNAKSHLEKPPTRKVNRHHKLWHRNKHLTLSKG